MNFRQYIEMAGFAHARRLLMGNVPSVNTIAILTAQNPMGRRKSPAENADLNRQLMAGLRAANYGPMKIQGKFGGNTEDSFLVPNIDRKTAVTLGQRWSQEAIIWGQKIKDRFGNPAFRFEYIQDGTTVQTRDVSVGTQDRDDYFSAVGGRKFVIPFFDDPHSDLEPGPKYGTVQKREGFELIPDRIDHVTYESAALPDTPEVHALVVRVRADEAKLAEPDKVEKWYWAARGDIVECLKELKKLGVEVS